jgi:LysR family hca operon transcriptional activator
MELRHLRYFIAVAEAGSFLTAAQRRLHTAQPSLSRQIRDLESEVGVKLLERQARGVALTAAGRVFLDHARLALLQVEAAAEGARQAEQPEKPVFTIGLLAGQEVAWLPHALRILREEAPGIEVILSSQPSPELALALIRGKLDVAFLRRETQTLGLSLKFLTKQPLIAVLPADHRLASRKAIPPQDLAREIFISATRVAPVLKSVIDDYAATVGITLKADYDTENQSTAVSLVASTGGITLFPLHANRLFDLEQGAQRGGPDAGPERPDPDRAHARSHAGPQNMLTRNVVARALEGKSPGIDLMLGYNKANSSPLLKRFLFRADELVANVQKQSFLRYVEAQ